MAAAREQDWLLPALLAAFDGEQDPRLSPLLDGRRLTIDEADESPDALTPAILAGLHEACATGRKGAGRWYTPANVAEAMVDWALEAHLAARSDSAPETLLRNARVVDPACGCGIFLLAAFRCLTARLPDADPGQIVARLHGYDTDPLAVELAQRRLGWAAQVAVGEGSAQVVIGDALTDLGDKRFDLVVTNPPYLSTKRGFAAEGREALQAGFKTAVGQFDAYALFIELGLRQLADGGGFAFLVPKPILSNQHMAPARELLASQRLTVLADPGPIFSAAVEPVVIAGAVAPPAASVIVRDPWTAQRVIERGVMIQPNGVWSWQAGSEPDADERLGDWFTITRGLECGKRSPGVLTEPRDGALPLLRGEDVTQDGIAAPASWFASELADRPHKPDTWFRGPKLLVRRVADRLIAAVDPSDALVLNTLYVLRPKPGCRWTVEELAAWLNSDAATALFRRRYGGPERLFPYVRQNQLVAFPLASRPSAPRPPGSE